MIDPHCMPSDEEVEAVVRAAVERLGPGLAIKDYVREVMVSTQGKMNPKRVVDLLKELV